MTMRIYKGKNLVDSSEATRSPKVDIVLSMGILSFLPGILVSRNRPMLEALQKLLGIDQKVSLFDILQGDMFALSASYSDEELIKRLQEIPEVQFVEEY